MRNGTGQRRWSRKGLDPIVEKKVAIALQADTYERTFETRRSGVDRQQCSLERDTTPTLPPATLRRMFSPGLGSCRSAASGLHICAPSSRMWRLVARRLWRTSSASGVGKSSVMRLPRSLRRRSCRLAQGTGQAPSGPPQPSVDIGNRSRTLNRVDNEGGYHNDSPRPQADGFDLRATVTAQGLLGRSST